MMALRAIRWRAGASLSVLLVASFATAVAAAGPIYLAAAGDSILQYGLRTAPPTAQGTGVELVTSTAGRPGTDRLTDAIDAALRGDVLQRAYPDRIVALEYRTRLLDTHGRPSALTAVVFRQDACAHLRLVTGRCVAEGTADEVMISRATADERKWSTGTALTVGHFTDPGPRGTDRVMRVVGVYEAIDPGGPYWFNDTRHYFGATGDRRGAANVPTLEALLVPRSAFAPVTAAPTGTMNAVVDLPLRRGTVHHRDMPALRAQLDAFGTALASAGVDQRGFGGSVVTGLRSVLNRADTGQRTLAVPMLLIVGQLLLLGWYVLFMVTAAAAEARGGEVALAKLRGLAPGSTLAFGMLESVLLLIVSVPIGVAVGAFAVRTFAGPVFGPDTPVGFSALSWLTAGCAAAGGLLAAVLGGLATFRRPVLAQWRRADRTVGGGSAAVDAVIVALAVAGLASMWWGGTFTNGRIDVLALAAPGLLGLAGALAGARLLPILVRSATLATRGSAKLGLYLALRQVGRRPGGPRMVAVLATAFAFATFSVLAWSVFADNRHDRAGVDTGAARVVTVDPYGGPDLRAVIERMDPDGRYAMAALDISSMVAAGTSVDAGAQNGPSAEPMRLLAVQPPRLHRVGFWRPDFGATSLTEVAGALSEPAPDPIKVHGDALRVAAMSRTTGDAAVDLGAELTTDAGDRVRVALLPTNTGYVSAAVPCTAGCQLRALTITRTVPGMYPVVGSVSVTAVEQHRPEADWQTVPDVLQPSRWQPANPRVTGSDEPVEKITAGLTITYAAPATVTRIGALAAAPSRIPAVVTTAYAPPEGTRGLSLAVPTGAPLEVNAARTVGVLPRAGDRGVLVSLDHLIAVRPHGYADLLPNQVWLAAGAPPDVLGQLAAAGVRTTGVFTAEQREQVLEHEGPALAVDLMLAGAGAAAILAAAGAVVNLHLLARRRAFELAAMRSVGVRRISMAAAVGTEQALLVGFAIMLGVGLGVLGARLALPAIPQYADLPSYPAVLVHLDPWLIAGVTGALAAALALALFVSGYALLRSAVPARLREAQA